MSNVTLIITKAPSSPTATSWAPRPASQPNWIGPTSTTSWRARTSTSATSRWPTCSSGKPPCWCFSWGPGSASSAATSQACAFFRGLRYFLQAYYAFYRSRKHFFQVHTKGYCFFLNFRGVRLGKWVKTKINLNFSVEIEPK